MNSTVVECTLISKKESMWYGTDKKQTELTFQVPYDTNSIYFQQSGGTAINLLTINQAVADSLAVGDIVEVLITKKEAVAPSKEQ